MNIFEMLNEPYNLPKKVKLFEAFSGIGCQRMGFERAGIDYEVVGISEIDKYALQSYQAMHNDLNNYGSITDIKGKDLPQIDVFTWSFPCTDLSKAGKQAGMNVGTRSGLVYEVLRILHEAKEHNTLPKVLIMENVVDLVQSKFIRQFQEVQLELEEIGYTNYVETMNAKDYGVAQNRDRVFMVSILGNYYYEFPKKFKLEKRLKDYLENEVDEKYYISEAMMEYFMNEHAGTFNRKERFLQSVHEDVDNNIGYAVTTRSGSRPTDNFIKEPMIGYAIKSREFENTGWQEISPTLCARYYKDPKVVYIPEATSKGYAEAYDGDGVYLNRPHQKRGVVQNQMIQTLKTSGNDVGVVVKESMITEDGNIKRYLNSDVIDKFNVGDCADISFPNGYNKGNRVFSGYSPALNLTTTKDNFIVKEESLRIRKLTPKECWRLMGIDDKYFDKAEKVVSNSQLYKQAGNGIVVDVFAEILKNMK